jgi:hypothetical protein
MASSPPEWRPKTVAAVAVPRPAKQQVEALAAGAVLLQQRQAQRQSAQGAAAEVQAVGLDRWSGE